MSASGTPNIGNVSAFTAGNDLPANPQTLLGCQCARKQDSFPFFLSDEKSEAFLTPPVSRRGMRMPRSHFWEAIRRGQIESSDIEAELNDIDAEHSGTKIEEAHVLDLMEAQRSAGQIVTVL
jgi:hypothetical protein